jgi:hypothetical protein
MDLKKSVWYPDSNGGNAKIIGRAARMGPPENTSQNAVTVTKSELRGTLGPAHDWKSLRIPFVELHMQLPEDGSDLSEKLVVAMQEFADKFIAENGLEPNKR